VHAGSNGCWKVFGFCEGCEHFLGYEFEVAFAGEVWDSGFYFPFEWDGVDYVAVEGKG